MTAPDLTHWIPDTPIPVETHPSDYAPTSASISTPNYKLHPWHSTYGPSPLWNSTTRHQQKHWSDRHPLVSNFGFFFRNFRIQSQCTFWTVGCPTERGIATLPVPINLHSYSFPSNWHRPFKLPPYQSQPTPSVSSKVRPPVKSFLASETSESSLHLIPHPGIQFCTLEFNSTPLWNSILHPGIQFHTTLDFNSAPWNSIHFQSQIRLNSTPWNSILTSF